MRTTMSKGRVEAFSDGVIAIVITIAVLEMKPPHGLSDLGALRPVLPIFVSYAMSFVYLAIYWNNHHHMLHAAERVSGGVQWANLHLLFWLSLIPFTTGWMGENHFAPAPMALYGAVLLMCAVAYEILQRAILRVHGPESALARAVGRDWKGKGSILLYVAAIPLAFVSPWIAGALFVTVALIWFIPDRRIERALSSGETGGAP